MKVFIENPANQNKKNIYNEDTLEYKKSYTVSREYPFPYGFVLDTKSGDGDNLDVFVITEQKLKSGEIIECEPIGLMEQIEKVQTALKNDYEIDHNILAVPKGDTRNNISKEEQDILRDFVLHVFDHLQLHKNHVGRFLGKDEAIDYILECSKQN